MKNDTKAESRPHTHTHTHKRRGERMNCADIYAKRWRAGGVTLLRPRENGPKMACIYLYTRRYLFVSVCVCVCVCV